MRCTAEKSLRMSDIRPGKHGRPRSDAFFGQAVMHVGRCQQAETRMMVLGVVPGKEDVAVGSGVLD